jgi:hypothetical protein
MMSLVNSSWLVSVIASSLPVAAFSRAQLGVALLMQPATLPRFRV